MSQTELPGKFLRLCRGFHIGRFDDRFHGRSAVQGVNFKHFDVCSTEGRHRTGAPKVNAGPGDSVVVGIVNAKQKGIKNTGRFPVLKINGAISPHRDFLNVSRCPGPGQPNRPLYRPSSWFRPRPRQPA